MKKKHLLPITFFLVMFLYNYASGFVHPVTPTLIIERNLPSQWYGYAGSAVSIGSFAIAPFMGKLCNYVSTRKMIIGGLLGYIFGQIIMATAYSGIQLLIGRMASGLLSSAATIGILNYIMNIGDLKERPKYLTIHATAGSVLNAAGYFTGGFLGSKHILIAFIAQGIVLVIAAVLAFLVLEDDTPYKIKPRHGMRLKEVNPFAAFADAGQFMTPLLLTFFFSFICIGIGMSCFENSFNYYIKDYFGLGSQYNGTFKACIAIGGLLINSTLTMWIIRHTDVNRSFVYSAFASFAFTACALLFFENVTGLALMFILYSIANFVFLSMTQNLVANRSTPETSNSMMGFYQALRSFGGVIGSFTQANLYAANRHYSFFFVAAIMGLGTLIAGLYSHLYRKQTKAA